MNKPRKHENGKSHPQSSSDREMHDSRQTGGSGDMPRNTYRNTTTGEEAESLLDEFRAIKADMEKDSFLKSDAGGATFVYEDVVKAIAELEALNTKLEQFKNKLDNFEQHWIDFAAQGWPEMEKEIIAKNKRIEQLITIIAMHERIGELVITEREDISRAFENLAILAQTFAMNIPSDLKAKVRAFAGEQGGEFGELMNLFFSEDACPVSAASEINERETPWCDDCTEKNCKTCRKPNGFEYQPDIFDDFDSHDESEEDE
jgi:hypothetical protein